MFAAAVPKATVAEVFDAAYAASAREYRTEYYYKNLIVSRIVFGRHSPRTAAALVELGAGASIADVVVVNGTTTAYEIKTDFDDFTRLPAQLGDYRACFERTYVVVSESRSARALIEVPTEFGVIAVGARGRLSERRPARGGLDGLRPGAMFRLLHQREVLDVLADTSGYTVDVPPARLWSRTFEIFSSLPVDVAHHHTTRHLRLRGQRAAELATKVPASLRARAYDVPVSRAAGGRITRRLQEKASTLLV
ncbi:sce7726 family protein [Cellulomonas endometrii]|uniref:sce7726 family protein n=1 Tax=Cellulomonas endometrii TaxID=3036301 RepID=UPI0024AD9F67|nr:sce7726 family protein [Cellulomonas endometrii]